MESLGFPLGGMGGGVYMASFDRVSDSVRGMTGTMLDMFRHPEELKKLAMSLQSKHCEVLTQQKAYMSRMIQGIT